MIPREWLKKIRHLELRTTRLVEELMAGPYHSVFKGRGMDFDEVREYQPGDEVRRIDWNVTARTGVTHIKKYIEEREMCVLLLVDVSASGGTGSISQSKRELAAELAAVFAFSALRSNDKVGAMLFAEGVEKYLRPAKGRRHVLRLLSDILTYQPKARGTDLTAALQHLNRAVSRRALVLVLSDFMAHDYERALKVTAQKHDVVAITILDATERALPDLGWIAFEDAETGEIVRFNSGRKKARAAYAAAAEARLEDLRRLFQRAGLDAIEATTDQPYRRNLLRFFETRLRRLRA